MALSASISSKILIPIGLLVLVAVILNAITLSFVVHRIEEDRNENNQVNLSLVESIRIEDVMGHLREFYRIAIEENFNRAFNTTGFNRTVAYINDYLSMNTNFQVKTTDFFVNLFELKSEPIVRISINNTIGTRRFSWNISESEYFYAHYSGAINSTEFIELTAIPNEGCTDADWLNANPSVTNRIALVKRGQCMFVEKVAWAIKYNATSIFIYNDGISTNPYEPLEISLDENNCIPTLFFSFDFGQELAYALNNSMTNIRAQIIIDVADNLPTHAANICADTPTGDATQTIVVGSHSDSVPAGPGINDNGYKNVLESKNE